MAAMTPTTAQPRPLYKSILAPALAEPVDDEEAEEELLLLELIEAVEVVLLSPLTASQICETTLLVLLMSDTEHEVTRHELALAEMVAWLSHWHE